MCNNSDFEDMCHTIWNGTADNTVPPPVPAPIDPQLQREIVRTVTETLRSVKKDGGSLRNAIDSLQFVVGDKIIVCECDPHGFGFSYDKYIAALVTDNEIIADVLLDEGIVILEMR
jgi:hypothetical protein